METSNRPTVVFLPVDYRTGKNFNDSPCDLNTGYNTVSKLCNVRPIAVALHCTYTKYYLD